MLSALSYTSRLQLVIVSVKCLRCEDCGASEDLFLSLSQVLLQSSGRNFGDLGECVLISCQFVTYLCSKDKISNERIVIKDKIQLF